MEKSTPSLGVIGPRGRQASLRSEQALQGQHGYISDKQRGSGTQIKQLRRALCKAMPSRAAEISRAAGEELEQSRDPHRSQLASMSQVAG